MRHYRMPTKCEIIKKDNQRVYNTPTWKKLRLYYLSQHPLCELCLEEGILTPAEDVHHIISFNDENYRNAGLEFDEDNLMSLCKYHHGKIHHECIESKYHHIVWDRKQKRQDENAEEVFEGL